MVRYRWNSVAEIDHLDLLFATDEATVIYEPGNLHDLAVETHVQPFNAEIYVCSSSLTMQM